MKTEEVETAVRAAYETALQQGALSIRQVCAYLSLSRQSLYRLGIPKIKVGRKVLYIKSELDNWLAAQRARRQAV
jgi:excisionase family DNA binding protein